MACARRTQAGAVQMPHGLSAGGSAGTFVDVPMLEMYRETPRRLLLDDPDLRSARVLTRMLEEDGYRVEHAADGASAMARLAVGDPLDALITDVRMARADGLEVAAFARSRKPTLPVLVTTGYPDRAAAFDEMRPAVVVLTKPIDYDALRGALDALVPVVVR